MKRETRGRALRILDALAKSRTESVEDDAYRLALPTPRGSLSLTLARDRTDETGARALSILIVMSEQSMCCSALVAGTGGAGRRSLPGAQAFALCDAGIHGVVRRHP